MFKNPAYLYYIPVGSELPVTPTAATEASKTSSTTSAPFKDNFSFIPKKHPLRTTSNQLPPTTTPRIVEDSETIRFSSPPPLIIHRQPFRTSPKGVPSPTPQPPTKDLKIHRDFTPQRRTQSRGYLPKPAPNPFAPRISLKVVDTVYKAPSTLPTPPETTTKQVVTSNAPPLSDHFGRRPSKIIEVYRPPSPKTPASVDLRLQHFSYGFNSAAGSAPLQQYKPFTKSSFSSGEKEAPVYRTLTKSYRAPSSLYQSRNDVQRLSTSASTQPNFVQAGNSDF